MSKLIGVINILNFNLTTCTFLLYIPTPLMLAVVYYSDASSNLIFAIASAGFKPFGHVLAQLKIV